MLAHTSYLLSFLSGGLSAIQLKLIELPGFLNKSSLVLVFSNTNLLFNTSKAGWDEEGRESWWLANGFYSRISFFKSRCLYFPQFLFFEYEMPISVIAYTLGKKKKRLMFCKEFSFPVIGTKHSASSGRLHFTLMKMKLCFFFEIKTK